MKKLKIISVLLLMMCCLCSCGGNDVRYDAVYDTQTKQYIVWGDTRKTVIEAFGEGEESARKYEDAKAEYVASVDYYPYDDNTENATVSSFRFTCRTNGRYKILGISSQEEFLEKFPTATSYFENEYLMSIGVNKNDGKYYFYENDDIDIPDDVICAYSIEIEFDAISDLMTYTFINCMLDEETEFYNSILNHTLDKVQIVTK